MFWAHLSWMWLMLSSRLSGCCKKKKSYLGLTSFIDQFRNRQGCLCSRPNHCSIDLIVYGWRQGRKKIEAHSTFFRLKIKRIKWIRSKGPSLLKPSDRVLCLLCAAIVQGTRGLMLSSILLSFISILVEMVGMRCTTCMAQEQQQKDRVALAGGIVLVIAGQRPFSSERILKGAISNVLKLLDFFPKASAFDNVVWLLWPQFDRQPEA